MGLYTAIALVASLEKKGIDYDVITREEKRASKANDEHDPSDSSRMGKSNEELSRQRQ